VSVLPNEHGQAEKIDSTEQKKNAHKTLVDPYREVIGIWMFLGKCSDREAGIFEKLLSVPMPMQYNLPCKKIASGKIIITKSDRRNSTVHCTMVNCQIFWLKLIVVL